MNYSFEYIDIILLAMIAGFIFLRLRGILGKKSGFEDKMSASFAHDFPSEAPKKPLNEKTFDENAKKDFIEGAKVTAKILRHGKEDKVTIIKMKRRKDYRKKQGHRQNYSEIQIEQISV